MATATKKRRIKGLDKLKAVSPDDAIGCRNARDALRLVKTYTESVKDTLVEVAYFISVMTQVLDQHEFEKFRTQCILNFRNVFGGVDQFDVYLSVGKKESPERAVGLSYHGHCGRTSQAILAVNKRIEDGEISTKDRDTAFKEALDDVSSQPIETLAFPLVPPRNKRSHTPKGGVMIKIIRKGQKSYIESSTGALTEVVWELLKNVYDSGSKAQRAKSKLTIRRK